MYDERFIYKINVFKCTYVCVLELTHYLLLVFCGIYPLSSVIHMHVYTAYMRVRHRVYLPHFKLLNYLAYRVVNIA